jgi:hypothetical protein
MSNSDSGGSGKNGTGWNQVGRSERRFRAPRAVATVYKVCNLSAVKLERLWVARSWVAAENLYPSEIPPNRRLDIEVCWDAFEGVF